jgi:hypothetical protein
VTRPLGDIIGIEHSTNDIWLGKSNAQSGTFTNSFFLSHTGRIDLNTATSYALVGDINGDAKEDYVLIKANGKVNVVISQGLTGANEVNFGSPILNISSIRFVTLGDINADGKKDLIFGLNNNKIVTSTSTGTSFNSPIVMIELAASDYYYDLMVKDLNADGRADLVYRNNLGKWYKGTSLGSSFTVELLPITWDPNVSWTNVMIK